MIPIVAFGASAGGPEAICEVLAALPPESDLAHVLVQHLDPAHESLLQRHRCDSVGWPLPQSAIATGL